MDITSNSTPITDAAPTPSDSCQSVSGLTIAGIVFGFIVFWPIGLAMLAWAIWRREIASSPLVQKIRRSKVPPTPNFQGLMARKPSNSALAAYLDREQLRLHDEQKKLDELVKAFEAFKDAERTATDQRDFEAFLKQRESTTIESEGVNTKPAG